jgi:hypothetical protein
LIRKTILSALMIFAVVAPIGLVWAQYQPQPHVMVWIVKSDAGANLWTITYENFRYSSIGRVEVGVASEVTIASASGSSTTLSAYVPATGSYAGWTTTQVSNKDVYWLSTSRKSQDRGAFDFYVQNTPCTLRYTIYDKDLNILRTGTVSIA